jgi:2-succinyl-6-hydroxy-2,4-cyclohexadiene-1-carboxylate synthase
MPRRRLVFLHGFTQTHHSWHACASLIDERLDGPSTLVFPDLPGHGLSGDNRSGIEAAAAQLATTIGASTVVGYSMGGRTALHIALAPGNTIERLVLIGATPGLADPAARAARRRADEERAEHVLAIGVDAFVDEWLSAPLFADLPDDPSGLEQRRRNTAAGLAHSLRTAGTGAQQSLWDRLPEIEVPVLVLAGELDTKFTEIGTRMARRLASARFTAVSSAGHAAHAEQPEAVAGLVADWLRSG